MHTIEKIFYDYTIKHVYLSDKDIQILNKQNILNQNFIYAIKEKINNHHILQKYNVKIISLGTNCFPHTLAVKCGFNPTLLQGGIRLPFDLSVHPIPAIFTLLANELKNYCADTIDKYSFDGTICFMNKKFGIIFNHDPTINDTNNQSKIKNFNFILKKRANDFMNLLTTQEQPKLFLMIIKDYLTTQEIELLQKIHEIIVKKYHNFFLCINTNPNNQKLYKETEWLKTILMPSSNYVWFKVEDYLSNQGVLFESTIIKLIIKFLEHHFVIDQEKISLENDIVLYPIPTKYYLYLSKFLAYHGDVDNALTAYETAKQSLKNANEPLFLETQKFLFTAISKTLYPLDPFLLEFYSSTFPQLANITPYGNILNNIEIHNRYIKFFMKDISHNIHFEIIKEDKNLITSLHYENKIDPYITSIFKKIYAMLPEYTYNDNFLKMQYLAISIKSHNYADAFKNLLHLIKITENVTNNFQLFNNKERELSEKFQKLENDYKILKLKFENFVTRYTGYSRIIYQNAPGKMLSDLLKHWYFLNTNKTLDLNNPKTYNEKIQWLKIYDNLPIKTLLADKYKVREYIKDKIGEQYLIPLLGVYNSFEEIDFSSLPEKFVLKCNHGSGFNIIVKDKNHIDYKLMRNKINKWLNINYAFVNGFEMQYNNIERKIIIEKFISNNINDNDLYDYKFLCFHGKVHYIQLLSERSTHLKMAIYDRNWNKQNFVCDYPLDQKNIPKPDKLDLLINLAECLSKDFIYVRVDFYLAYDHIFFGEMTFTPYSGINRWSLPEINNQLGELIHLPDLPKNS